MYICKTELKNVRMWLSPLKRKALFVRHAPASSGLAGASASAFVLLYWQSKVNFGTFVRVKQVHFGLITGRSAPWYEAFSY